MDHGSPTCKRNLTSVEAGTVLVECSPTVLDEIRETALDESRRHNCGLLFSSGKVGLDGVLFGKREETRVRIVSLRSLVSDRSSSRSTTLGEADRQAFLIALISGAPDGEASGL